MKAVKRKQKKIIVMRHYKNPVRKEEKEYEKAFLGKELSVLNLPDVLISFLEAAFT